MRAILVMALILVSAGAQAQTYVNGYFKSDGTYVQPHYRSSPNGTTSDNYSTKGNTNPYTGQHGTRNPSPGYGSGYGSSPGGSSSCNSVLYCR